MKLLGTKEDFPQLFLHFLLGPSESQTVKQLKKNIAILMENKNLQQSLLEAYAKALNIATIHHANNRHMRNGLVYALNTINTTVYHSKIEIQRLNYACNFFLNLADIDHRINQLCNGLRKLEADVATIYSYINTLGSKIVTPMLIDPIDLKNNIY